jgi:hypothetical protein
MNWQGLPDAWAIQDWHIKIGITFIRQFREVRRTYTPTLYTCVVDLVLQLECALKWTVNAALWTAFDFVILP